MWLVAAVINKMGSSGTGVLRMQPGFGAPASVGHSLLRCVWLGQLIIKIGMQVEHHIVWWVLPDPLA